MTTRVRSSLGGLLLARLLFAHQGARRYHSGFRFDFRLGSGFGLAVLALVLLLAPAALAQRGATSGTRGDSARTVRVRPDRAARPDPSPADAPTVTRRDDRAGRRADADRAADASDRRGDARGSTDGTRPDRSRPDARTSAPPARRLPDGGAVRPRDPAAPARPDARYDPTRTGPTRGRPGDYGDDRARDDRSDRDDRDRYDYDDRRDGGRYDPGYYDHDRYGDGGYDRWRSGIDFAWPWEQRYARGWSPLYRYRQVVRLESGGRDRRWDTRLELRTTYRQRVLSASGARALIELKLEGLELYQNGRYLGRIAHFPERFERVRATLHRNGRADFDRDLLVVGDARMGFELVATRHYDGYAYADWRRGDALDAAFLDFRRGRAERVRESRLFDPYEDEGYAPVSILPEDADWLGDFGRRSLSASPYYAADGRRGDAGYDDYRYDDGYFYGRRDDGVYDRTPVAPRGETSGRPDDARSERPGGYNVPRRATEGTAPERAAPTLRRQSDDTHTTGSGARVRVRREAEITRVE